MAGELREAANRITYLLDNWEDQGHVGVQLVVLGRVVAELRLLYPEPDCDAETE